MRAFVYTETPLIEDKLDHSQKVYHIYFSGKCPNGCKTIQKIDEREMKSELLSLKERGIGLVSRVPVEFRRLEDSVQREPYDLSFLNNAPAGNKCDK